MRKYVFVTTLFAAFSLLPLTVVAADNPVYLRGGVGWSWAEDATFSDTGSCSQTQPPALFGCGDGSDGRTLGAYGDFGDSAAFLAGVGYRFSPWLRAELDLGYRPGLAFSGQANFLSTPGAQPVHGDVDSVSLMAAGYVDFPEVGSVQPWLSLGIGVAHNSIDAVTYRFPGFGTNAETRVAGGSETDFAWFAGAGVSVDISDAMKLDIGYRYLDLGDIHTNAGTAANIRGGSYNPLAVGGTQADLEVHQVMLSLRYLP